MTSFWSRYFPERSVANVRGPTWVRVDATIVTPNEITSPLSSVACAAARWWLMTERTAHASRGGGHQLRYRVHASGWFGETLLLASADGPSIVVPLAGAALTNDVDGEDATLLTTTPPELAPSLRNIAIDHGPACYREIRLAHGDRVQLRAVVEPIAGGGGYRESASRPAELRACPEHGAVQLYDHLLG